MRTLEVTFAIASLTVFAGWLLYILMYILAGLYGFIENAVIVFRKHGFINAIKYISLNIVIGILILIAAWIATTLVAGLQAIFAPNAAFDSI